MSTVQQWFESLPENLIAHDVALLLVRASICILSGRSEEAERFLVLAESIPYEGALPDGTASVEAGVETLRGVFGLGGIQRTLEAARHAVELDGARTSPFYALVRFGLGSSLYPSGETSLARKQFEEALQWAGAGQSLLRMVSLSYLSIVAA